MKELKTIRGETFLVDDEDYEKAKQYQWTVQNDRNGRPRVITSTSKHRGASYKQLVLGTGPKFTLQKNNNPFDLRKENIMVFDTRSEFGKVNIRMNGAKQLRSDPDKIPKKLQNKGKTRINKTGYIGLDYSPIHFHPWRASINHKRKCYRLGHFAIPEHAAYAYDAKAIELYGERAKRNFPNLTMEELTERLDRIKAEYCDRQATKYKMRKYNFTKSSQYVGVTIGKPTKTGKKWGSGIWYQNKRCNLGHFDSEEDAAIVYDAKALELFGETATRNFPDLTAEELTEKLAQIQSAYKTTKTSQYIGVSLHKDLPSHTRKWRARIRYQRKIYSLGSFYTEEEAAHAYDAKALKLFGKNAKLNFPLQ